MSASREQDFITLAKQYNKAVWDGINALKSMQTEWNALDYGTTLDDGVGANAGLTKTDIGAVVFDTTNALLTTLAAGHATNMAKLL